LLPFKHATFPPEMFLTFGEEIAENDEPHVSDLEHDLDLNATVLMVDGHSADFLGDCAVLCGLEAGTQPVRYTGEIPPDTTLLPE
jgi:hypothetical protein